MNSNEENRGFFFIYVILIYLYLSKIFKTNTELFHGFSKSLRINNRS